MKQIYITNHRFTNPVFGSRFERVHAPLCHLAPIYQVCIGAKFVFMLYHSDNQQDINIWQIA